MFYQSSDIKNYKNKLSSIVSGDNFVYGISSKANNKLLSFKELPYLEENFFLEEKKLHDIFNNIEYIDNIEEIQISILSQEFVLCPLELYSENAESDLLQTVTIKQYLNDYSIENKFIPQLNSYLIYTIPTVLKKFLSNKFNKVNFYHANEIFIPKYNFIGSYDNLLLCNLNNGYLQTALYKKNKLIQTNVYEIKAKEDILYHIISNLTNHGIPVNLAKVLLGGRIEKDSAIFTILNEHIKNIDFIKNIDRSLLSNVFLGKSRHLFFDIFSLSQCE